MRRTRSERARPQVARSPKGEDGPKVIRVIPPPPPTSNFHRRVQRTLRRKVDALGALRERQCIEPKGCARQANARERPTISTFTVHPRSPRQRFASPREDGPLAKIATSTLRVSSRRRTTDQDRRVNPLRLLAKTDHWPRSPRQRFASPREDRPLAEIAASTLCVSSRRQTSGRDRHVNALRLLAKTSHWPRSPRPRFASPRPAGARPRHIEPYSQSSRAQRRDLLNLMSPKRSPNPPLLAEKLSPGHAGFVIHSCAL